MDKRVLTFILASMLMLSSMTLVVPRVQAAAEHPIVLPFGTSWEDDDPAHGREDSVDYSKDFSSPKCGRVNEVAAPDIFGYDFGSKELKATGKFDSSNSYCYFNLFDTTPQSDWGPPFKIKSHTFINIWYRHDVLADCMIDAQIYNSETHQYWTLRDFYRVECIDHLICKTYYVVDQNGVRIHPAYRYEDPVGSWQFASFDLSIVYEHNPNWYVTKIWIGFDNRVDGATGQARTYFDMLHISYGGGK
ncbi:MAG: hypothetical protein ACUVRA_04975 [Candidatus Bathyarchaeaceae archaeon]